MSADRPSNLFSLPLLDRLAEGNGAPPLTLSEAHYTGPWRVEPDGDRWRVTSDVCGLAGKLRFSETAAMLAAVLPGVNRPPLYHLSGRRDGAELMTSYRDPGCSGRRWYAGRISDASVGVLRLKDDAIAPALDVAHGILIDPESLAWLLLAADPRILARVGEIVARRVQPPPAASSTADE